MQFYHSLCSLSARETIEIYILASVTLNKWSKRAEILARQVKFGAGHFLTKKDLRFTAVNGPLGRIIDL